MIAITKEYSQDNHKKNTLLIKKSCQHIYNNDIKTKEILRNYSFTTPRYLSKNIYVTFISMSDLIKTPQCIYSIAGI